MKSKIKLILLLSLCISTLSCNKDNSSNTDTNTFIGEWLRSDFTDNFEYKLTFNTNNDVLRTASSTSNEGVVSSAASFNWNVSNEILTISEFDSGNDLVSSYQFLPNGNLKLSEFSEVEFIKQ